MTTRLDFIRAAKARIAAIPNTNVRTDQIDVPGSTLNIVLHGVAGSLAEACLTNTEARQNALLLSTATEADLDARVIEASSGKITRLGASASRAVLNIVRQAPATGDLMILKGSKMQASGQTFTLDSDVFCPSGYLLGQLSYWTNTALGEAGNVSLSGATFINPPEQGITLAVPQGNPEYAVGGAPRESDDQLRARIRAYLAGKVDGVEKLRAAILATPGVQTAEVIEELDSNGDPTGIVSAYVGDINGRANAALLESVKAQLRFGRMLGQIVKLYASIPTLVQITLSFGVINSFDQAATILAARSAVVSAVNKLASGQNLTRALILAALQTVPGVYILNTVPYGCTTPAADIIASSASVLFRTSLDLTKFA